MAKITLTINIEGRGEARYVLPTEYGTDFPRAGYFSALDAEVAQFTEFTDRIRRIDPAVWRHMLVMAHNPGMVAEVFHDPHGVIAVQGPNGEITRLVDS